MTYQNENTYWPICQESNGKKNVIIQRYPMEKVKANAKTKSKSKSQSTVERKRERERSKKITNHTKSTTAT